MYMAVRMDATFALQFASASGAVMVTDTNYIIVFFFFLHPIPTMVVVPSVTSIKSPFP